MADPHRYSGARDDTGTPRWVKVSGIIGAVLVLLVVTTIFIGHGPGRHMPGGDTSPSTDRDYTPREGERR